MRLSRILGKLFKRYPVCSCLPVAAGRNFILNKKYLPVGLQCLFSLPCFHILPGALGQILASAFLFDLVAINLSTSLQSYQYAPSTPAFFYSYPDLQLIFQHLSQLIVPITEFFLSSPRSIFSSFDFHSLRPFLVLKLNPEISNITVGSSLLMLLYPSPPKPIRVEKIIHLGKGQTDFIFFLTFLSIILLLQLQTTPQKGFFSCFQGILK